MKAEGSDNDDTSPIEISENRSPDQRDYDRNNWESLSYTTESENDQRNRSISPHREEEDADNLLETSYHDEDPVKEDEDMLIIASLEAN